MPFRARYLAVTLTAVFCAAACQSPTGASESEPPIDFEITFQNSTSLTVELEYRGCAGCPSGQQGQQLGRFTFAPSSLRTEVLRQVNDNFDVYIQATLPPEAPGRLGMTVNTSCRITKVGYPAKRASVVLADGGSGPAFRCVGW